MKLGAYFKRKRLDKGLTEDELAKLIRHDFEPSLLWDFESGDDNDIDGWSIIDFKRYCEALGTKPTDFADVPSSDMSHLPLALIVKTRREEKRYSIAELADMIGYEPIIIEAIENRCNDTVVCIDVLRKLASELDIPFRLLLEKI
jgi:transcriptional regulator with XRE-family HTH domain